MSTADAPAYAAQRDAVLARGRREGQASGAISLSPASFDDVEGVDRVVLPSPNGSTIAFALAQTPLLMRYDTKKDEPPATEKA